MFLLFVYKIKIMNRTIYSVIDADSHHYHVFVYADTVDEAKYKYFLNYILREDRYKGYIIDFFPEIFLQNIDNNDMLDEDGKKMANICAKTYKSKKIDSDELNFVYDCFQKNLKNNLKFRKMYMDFLESDNFFLDAKFTKIDINAIKDI